MKITVGSLFLAVAVFLDFIELISSAEPEQTTLAQLFPECNQNGYLPPFRSITRDRETITSTAFTQIGNHTLRRPVYSSFFLARGHVIFAWKGKVRSGDLNKEYIVPLWELFPSLEHEERWVFDMTRNHWVTLNQNEFNKLGFGYNCALVREQETVARRHRLRTGNRIVDARAHRTAYLRANEETNILQGTEALRMRWDETIFAYSAMLIRERYRKAYDAVFREIARDYGYHI